MKLTRNLLLFLLMCLPLSLFSGSIEGKFRVGAFLPSHKLIREIYADAIPEYQGELSYRFYSDCYWEAADAWANVGYLSKKGHSIGLHDSTRLRFLPISAGLKYTAFLPCNFATYIGMGAAYSILRIKDDSDYVRRHTHRYRWGWVGKLGLQYQLNECGFVEVFCDYLFTKFHFSGTKKNVPRHSVRLDGFLIGGGLGASF